MQTTFTLFAMKMAGLVVLLLALQTINAQTVTFENIPVGEDTIYDGSDQSGGFLAENDYFFPNTYVEDPVYGGFWASGWAVSGTTDSGTSGFLNLFSAKPGSGYNGSAQYAVGQQNAVIHFLNNEGEDRVFGGFYITNTTYAHNSMRDGDGFAKKFGGETGDDPDFFKMIIKGYDDGELRPDSIEFYLADYRFEDNSQDYIVSDWQYIDISDLNAPDSLLFTLSSSDVGDHGINTPLFFALDNLETTFVFGTEDINKEAVNYAVFPNPVADEVVINRKDNRVLSTNVRVMDMSGKVIKEYPFYHSEARLDLSHLEAGMYMLQLETADFVATKKVVKQ